MVLQLQVAQCPLRLQAELATTSLRDLGRSDLSNEEEDEDTEEQDELCQYDLIRKSANFHAEEDDD